MSIDPVLESIYLKEINELLRKARMLQQENSSLKGALAKGAVQNFISSLPISTQGAIKKFVTILETYFASVTGATPGPTQTPENSKSGSLENSDRKFSIFCPVCGEDDCAWWSQKPTAEAPKGPMVSQELFKTLEAEHERYYQFIAEGLNGIR